MRFRLTSAIPISILNVEPVKNLAGELGRGCVAEAGHTLRVIQRVHLERNDGYIMEITAPTGVMHGGSFCPSGVIAFVSDRSLAISAEQII